MKTVNSNTLVKAVVQQVTNNTTSWIGHWQGETKNRTTGQTFYCPAEGELDCIEVLSNFVSDSGIVDMTVHKFDPVNKQWGPVIGSSKVKLSFSDTGKWIAFPLNGLHLDKGSDYGFRLKSESCLIGVGEAAGSADHLPYLEGQEWTATSDDLKGNYFSYLSLAFKVELRA